MKQGKSLPSIHRYVSRSIALIATVGVIALAAVTWLVLSQEINALMDGDLERSARAFEASFVQASRPGEAGSAPSDEEHVWQVVDLRTGAVHMRSPRAPSRALLAGTAVEPTDSEDGEWRVMSRPMPAASQPLTLVVGQALERRRRSVHRAVLLVTALCSVVGLMTVSLIRLRLRRALNPLQSMARVVERFDPMQPETAPRRSGWAELAPMAASIADLGQRLSQRIVSERAFNAHAAHALRTPLAGIDAQLAVAQRVATPELKPWLSQTRAAANRLSRVMQSLITMSRSGSEARPRQVQLADVLALWADDSVRVVAHGLHQIEADPDLLSAVLANLLDNARAHGATHVNVQTDATVIGWWRLRIHDNGRGCPEPILATLRAALAKHDYSPGSGLRGMGLLLADLVMSAHHGCVLLPSVEQGFCVELKWPPRR